jgi:hypothetical protein
MRSPFFSLALCLSALVCHAQKLEFWPGTQYDPAVPTIQSVLGHAPGEVIAPPADIVRYFEALAAAAPGRIRVVDYGRTWEGRRLIYAVVASAANMQRLDQIKAAQKALADPRRTPQAEAQKLIESSPVVVGLSYGVHGNEISSPDAAMLTAYHLLAARGDALVDGVTQNVVVLINPSQNPDGRNRFVQNFNQNVGLEPDAYPLAAERQEPWPGGRSNHYLFDLNRDWLALTQPETQGIVRYLLEWLPAVHVDLHEMGANSTYFFTPGAAPFNPHLTKDQKDQMMWFGATNAKWFDKFGWTYFTREVFDEFYPGYGASWPWFYGGMGMTYENASVRGLVVRRSDDTLYTFPESVQKHFVGSIATCEAASTHRKELLANFYRYQVTALEQGEKESVKEYVLPRSGDTSAVDKLARLLVMHGVEVKQATAPFKNGSREFPVGSYVIPLAQPRNRFIHAALDPDVPMDAAFTKEQERRRKKDLPDEIYDITAWSLPMTFGVESVGVSAPSRGDFRPVDASAAQKGTLSGKAEVAYLVPWGTLASARFLTAALRADLRVLSAGKQFKQGGRAFPSGTLIVMVKQNGGGVHEKVLRCVELSGAEVVATNSGWVDEGIDFGSDNVSVIRKPAIALLWDSPTSSISAGQARFVLERQYGYPVTAIRVSVLPAADLSKFQVIIIPGTGGGLASMIQAPVVERLKAWVRNGGVLIGLAGAVNFLSNPQVGLLAVQQESLASEAAKPADAPKPPSAPGAPAAAAPAASPTAPGKIITKEEEYQKAIKADTEMPDSVAGVLVRAKVDPETWVTVGLPETLYVMIDGPSIYTPIKRDRGRNAVVFAAENLVAGGYMWEENRKQLAYKPFVITQKEGRGAVIGFTGDPNFRAFMDGLNVLFLNAVFRTPPSGGFGGADGGN